MNRLLLVGALAAAFLVPAATAAPTATHTLRGTVVAKDRAQRALVVALPGGKVQTLVAPAAFGRTGIGRRVVIRYTGVAGRLPVALGVTLEGRARYAVIRGTMVRVVKRNAIINAGGSVLKVTLKAPKRQRALASAKDAPKAGDTVKVEVEIDDDGSLDASSAVVAAAPTGVTAGSEGEMEVRGKVAPGLTLATSTAPGSITVQTSGTDVTCVIPIGATLTVRVGDMIELKCDLIGGKWTVRVARGEDDDSGDDDSSEVEVQGTISAPITTAVTVGAVSCTIPISMLTQVQQRFAVNDVVKMECVKITDAMTLKEIEKKGGDSGEQSDDDDDDNDDGDNEVED